MCERLLHTLGIAVIFFMAAGCHWEFNQSADAGAQSKHKAPSSTELPEATDAAPANNTVDPQGSSPLPELESVEDLLDPQDDSSTPAQPGIDGSLESSPLLLVAEGISSSIWELNRREHLGATRCIVIYGHFIDPDKTGFVQLPLMRKWISENIAKDHDGYVVLDIEDPYFRQLSRGPGTEEFDQAQTQMLAALRQAKLMRPKAKFSYYNLPIAEYWLKDQQTGSTGSWATATDDAKREAQALALAPKILLAELDFLAPSIYDFYQNSAERPHIAVDDATYVTNRVRIAREIADGRPVLPFVWHRYHSSNKQVGMQLIPDAEWQAGQLTTTIQAGASGIIWWGADEYFSRLARKHVEPGKTGYEQYMKHRIIFEAEMIPGDSYPRHLDRIHEHYLRLSAKVLFSIPYEQKVYTRPPS